MVRISAPEGPVKNLHDSMRTFHTDWMLTIVAVAASNTTHIPIIFPGSGLALIRSDLSTLMGLCLCPQQWLPNRMSDTLTRTCKGS